MLIIISIAPEDLDVGPNWLELLQKWGRNA